LSERFGEGCGSGMKGMEPHESDRRIRWTRGSSRGAPLYSFEETDMVDETEFRLLAKVELEVSLFMLGV
jgi:hypothetical protein